MVQPPRANDNPSEAASNVDGKNSKRETKTKVGNSSESARQPTQGQKNYVSAWFVSCTLKLQQAQLPYRTGGHKTKLHTGTSLRRAIDKLYHRRMTERCWSVHLSSRTTPPAIVRDLRRGKFRVQNAMIQNSEEKLPLFITYASYSHSGVKGLVSKPSDRSGTVKALIEKARGKFVALYNTRGSNDVVLVSELADGSDAVAVGMAVAATGALSK
jgi:uncharacterized protein with GYD domain